MSKLDEKCPSYAQVNVLVPKWHLAYFVPIDGHFCIYINFDVQTNFEVNQIQISHSIPKNTSKSH